MAMVEVADPKRPTPKHKEVFEIGGEIVAKKILSYESEISVFEKGYVLMVEGKHHTVFELHKYKSVEFKAVEGKGSVFDISFFENEEWYIYLMLIGTNRLEENQENRKLISLNSSGLENVISQKTHDPLDCVIRQETEREVKKKLTIRQQHVVNEYYYEETAQAVIAENLGISQQATSKLIKRSIHEIREVMHVEETAIKRTRNKK